MIPSAIKHQQNVREPLTRPSATRSPFDGESIPRSKNLRVEPLNPPLTPPKRGTLLRARPALLPSSEGLGVGRFMESAGVRGFQPFNLETTVQMNRRERR